MLGGAAILLTTAAGVGIVAAIQLGKASWVASMIGAGMVQVPAMWLVVSVTVALYGLMPRVAAFGWAVLGYAAVVGLMGDALDLPDGVRALSPFHHVPELPGSEIGVIPTCRAGRGHGLPGRHRSGRTPAPRRQRGIGRSTGPAWGYAARPALSAAAVSTARRAW